MKKTILFPNVGRRVELVKRFRDSAISNDVELTIIATEISADAPALHFCDNIYILPKERNEVLLDRFKSIIQAHSVDVIVCTIDPDLEFFSENRLAFEPNVDLLLSDKDIISASSDKNKTESLFRTVGVETPHVMKYPDSFPLFAKPAKGSGSFGAMLIQNNEELDSYLKKFEAYQPIFQEYISGKEYTLDCFITKHGQVFVSPRERIKVRAGEVIVSKTVYMPLLETEAKKLLGSGGFYGPVTLQTIVSEKNKKNYFIEINARFGGGAILSLEAGLDSIRYILTGKIQSKNIKADLKMLRYDMSVFVDERE